MLRKLLLSVSAVLILTSAMLMHRAVADGTAQAKVTVNGQTFTFSGGSCTQSGSVFSLSIGVPPMQAPAGTHPDYFGAYIPDAPGNFADGAISISKAGKHYDLGAAKGLATKSGATFTGTPLMQPNVQVTGSFSC